MNYAENKKEYRQSQILLLVQQQVCYYVMVSKTVYNYVNYARTLFENYGDKVKYWITLNEQNIFTSLGWLTAQHPPGKFDDQKMFYQVNHHVFMAHAKAVLAYREMGGTGEIGASFAYTPSYALGCKPMNAMAKRDYDELKNFWWMDVYEYGRYPKAAMAYLKKKGYAPELGMQGIYKNPANPYLMTTDWDWTIDPMGLRFCCREITSRYGLPIIISENGLGAFDKKTEDNQIHK